MTDYLVYLVSGIILYVPPILIGVALVGRFRKWDQR